MDSDCLIKLTKAGLKEIVCNNFQITIPSLVMKETVEHNKDYPDSTIIADNIKKGIIKVKENPVSAKGEDAVFKLFQKHHFSSICSDDKKFIRMLRLFDVSYVTPAVLILLLYKDKKISRKKAFEFLERIKPYVSDDEYNIVKLYLTFGGKK